MQTKQVIVIRKDLNMRKGKLAAQASHGSQAFITSRIRDELIKLKNQTRALIFRPTETISIELTIEEAEWLLSSFRKICVSVDSEEKLIEIQEKAERAGLTEHLITDNGLTEFGGVPTRTCIGIGPHEDSKFEGITDGLPLL
jgi:PTH2 family peptidyl-tRNA hydrolase